MATIINPAHDAALQPRRATHEARPNSNAATRSTATPSATQMPATSITAARKFIRRPGEGAATRADGNSANAAPASSQGTSSAALDRPRRAATDDEILGITDDSAANRFGARASHSANDDPLASDESYSSTTSPASSGSDAEAGRASEASHEADAALPDALPAALRAALEENPELRRAWQEREDYRQAFASPEEARAATAQLRDLDRMDALFFSSRPEDHAQLARAIAALDPAAFASLAQAMSALATPQGAGGRVQGEGNTVNSPELTRTENSRALSYTLNPAPPAHPANGAPSAAQSEFFHATNAAAVEGVLGAIESQVEKLLPEGVSKTARARVVGEIYRELDSTLRSNHQLSSQLREAFRSGALDADHQRGIVSMVIGRARQALPAVAKRVLNEWTSTIVAANQERRNRQRTAERRVDIAGASGAGNDGRRPITPRDINYTRMSDADILNM
jgi:hypothetical protein